MYTEILPIIFFLLIKRKFFIERLWVIYFLITLSFINDFYALYLLYYQHRSNFLFYNIYQLTETFLLYYFFYLIIKNAFVKKVILFLSIPYIILWLLSLLKFGDNSYFSSCTNFENITVLGLIIYYYYEQIIIINTAFIYAESTFWIVTAFFIYIAGIFFLFLYIPSLNLPENEKYYVLTYIFTIIRTVLLCVAIFIKPGFSKKIESNNFI